MRGIERCCARAIDEVADAKRHPVEALPARTTACNRDQLGARFDREHAAGVTDAFGNQATNQIFVGPHAGEVQQDPSLAALHDGRVVVAYDNVNLTTGVFRGGRRPIDLYYRIHSGINGSNMTAFGKALKPDQIWDLVNFLEILPYPKLRERFEINID